MRKPMIFFFAILCMAGTAKSQATNMFFELGGPGIASFNLDTRFTAREDGIGGRIGVGGFSIDDVGAVFVPVGINYLFGKNTRHYFEVGAGFTYVNYNDEFDNDDDGLFSSSFGHLNFGYRMQPKNGGFLFRAGIVPIFNKSGFLPYYAGISFGYKF